MEKNNLKSTKSFRKAGLQIVESVIGTTRDICEVALLEAKLANRSMLMMLKIGIIISVLALITWGCLLSAVFFLLSSLGFSNLLIFTLLALTHGILIIPLLIAKNSYKENLDFNATRRLLKMESVTNHEQSKDTN